MKMFISTCQFVIGTVEGRSNLHYQRLLFRCIAIGLVARIADVYSYHIAHVIVAILGCAFRRNSLSLNRAVTLRIFEYFFHETHVKPNWSLERHF